MTVPFSSILQTDENVDQLTVPSLLKELITARQAGRTRPFTYDGMVPLKPALVKI